MKKLTWALVAVLSLGSLAAEARRLHVYKALGGTTWVTYTSKREAALHAGLPAIRRRLPNTKENEVTARRTSDPRYQLYGMRKRQSVYLVRTKALGAKGRSLAMQPVFVEPLGKGFIAGIRKFGLEFSPAR